MTAVTAGALLAAGAAVALNAGYLLQHAGAAGAPAVTPRRPLASLTGLLGSPKWLVGAATGTAGWAMHISALAHAPLSLVQAFVTGGMALTAPIATRAFGHRLSRGEQAGIAVMALSLALLGIGIGDRRATVFRAGALVAYLVAVAAGALVLAALAVRRGRASALGLAGGVFYGVADTAIKALTATAPAGAMRLVTSPWLAAAAAATLAAFFCFQRGLQLGRALPVIALMTAGTNVVSIVGGLAVFDDPLGATPALVVLHAAAFASIVPAAWLLAPSQAALVSGDTPAPLRPASAAAHAWKVT